MPHDVCMPSSCSAIAPAGSHLRVGVAPQRREDASTWQSGPRGIGPLRIYIAGAITRDPNYKPKFRRAQADWCLHGHDAIVPLDNGQPEDACYDDQMTACYAMLDTCEAIVLLEDWTNSPGAQNELARAIGRGMLVLFHEDGVIA